MITWTDDQWEAYLSAYREGLKAGLTKAEMEAKVHEVALMRHNLAHSMGETRG